MIVHRYGFGFLPRAERMLASIFQQADKQRSLGDSLWTAWPILDSVPHHPAPMGAFRLILRGEGQSRSMRTAAVSQKSTAIRIVPEGQTPIARRFVCV